MKAQRIDTWIWVLIYGGLLALCLGFFVLRSGSALGWPLCVLGLLAFLLGVVLVVVRSRIPPPGQ